MEILVELGFRPTDEEIIRLLEKKRLDPGFSVHAIVETNIYDFEPFQLSGLSPIPSDEEWCSFFCEPKYINAHSNNVHRRTKTGSWKITSKPSEIKAKCSKEVIGKKDILTFYEIVTGCKNIKTDWVMHQYSVKDNSLYKKDFVVCRVKRNEDKKRLVKKNENKKRRILTDVKGQGHKKHRTSTSDEGNISPESQLVASNNLISNSRNHVAENTTLESQLQSSNNLISNSGNHGTQNISLESALLSEVPSNSNWVYNSRNHITEDTSSESYLQLQSSNHLISNSGNHGTQNTFPESQLLLEVPSNSNWVSNSRDHIAEDTSSKLQLQLLLKFLSSNYSISNFRNQVAENTSLESQTTSWLWLQLLSSNYLISNSRNHITENTYPEISNSRNHITENTYPELQLLPSISDSRNHVAENTSPESQLLSEVLPSNNWIPNPRFAENTFSELQSQLLSSNDLISNCRNHVAENSSLESQLLPSSSNCIAENTLQLYPTLSNAVDGCNGLDQASFSGLQSPITQEQRFSYSSVFSNNYEVLNSPFGIAWEDDLMNPQWVLHDDYPCEETGHATLPPDSNSSKPVGGLCGGDSSVIDTATFNEWGDIDNMSVYNIPYV